MKTLYSVILAAGGSRRLGRPKQLLKYQREPLLIRALRVAELMTPGRVVVVLGAQRIRMRLLLNRRPNLPTILVDNGRWRDGMASSLQCGLSVLPDECGAALLMVVDQPAVTEHSLKRLTEKAHQHPARLVAAHYSGQPGVPAIIPRRHWTELKRLSGDRGARGLLRARQPEVITVAMPEADWDIDQPADAARL